MHNVDMIVAIVIGAVLALLAVLLKWADRRDLAKGHVNRGMGDIRATMRARRVHLRSYRRLARFGGLSDIRLGEKADRNRR